LRNSDDIVREAKNLSEEAEYLEHEREELREKLFLKIVGKIEIGGIIKGKCDECKLI